MLKNPSENLASEACQSRYDIEGHACSIGPQSMLWAEFVWVDALNPPYIAEVMWGGSVILTTLFLGKPPEAVYQY